MHIGSGVAPDQVRSLHAEALPEVANEWFGKKALAFLLGRRREDFEEDSQQLVAIGALQQAQAHTAWVFQDEQDESQFDPRDFLQCLRKVELLTNDLPLLLKRQLLELLLRHCCLEHRPNVAPKLPKERLPEDVFLQRTFSQISAAVILPFQQIIGDE
jgi:hypothetical protein